MPKKQAGSVWYIWWVSFQVGYIQEMLLGAVLVNIYLARGRFPCNNTWLTKKISVYKFALNKLINKMQTIKKLVLTVHYHSKSGMFAFYQMIKIIDSN